MFPKHNFNKTTISLALYVWYCICILWIVKIESTRLTQLQLKTHAISLTLFNCIY